MTEKGIIQRSPFDIYKITGIRKKRMIKKNTGHVDRRSFVMISGVMGLSLALDSIIHPAVEAFSLRKSPHRISGTRLAMGTTVSMTLISISSEIAEEAMTQAYEEVNRVSALMDRFDERSPIARLNTKGILKDAHPDIIEVISSALRYYRLTGGAFDITVKPLIDLFKRKFSAGGEEYPSESEIAAALDLVGSDKIEINGRDIVFKKQGMGVTLDGIAKGYVVDRASRILLNHRIDNHLINAGGDIKAMGVRSDGRPWTVAIQDPKKNNDYLDRIYLTGIAVATSGNYENYFDRDRIFHHIVNPKTGRSPVLNISASVIAPKTMEADILATSLIVMDSKDGLGLIDSLPRCAALVTSRSNQIQRSSGWKGFTTQWSPAD
jgi:thiamine biosynthesis lipoprotein